jgi:F0F1-type ATP synthase membrane subunit b/b'
MELPSSWLFFGTIGILTILEVIALYMIASYFRLLKSYDSVMKKQHEMEVNVHAQSEKLLAAASEQSKAIVAQANAKAQQVIQQAEFFNEGTQDKINEILAGFLQQQTVIFQQLFESVRVETQNRMNGMGEHMQKQAEEQLGTVSRQFGLAMTVAQKQAQQQLDLAYAQAHKGIEAYKQQRIKLLNQVMGQFIEQVATRFLKTKLSSKEHEELLMEALDEAASQHLF